MARAGVSRDKIQQAEDLLTAAEDKITSSSLTVTQAHKVVASRAPKKVYLLASISKPMTSTGVMLLSDRGELSIEDPVHKFIPEFTEGDRKLITIRHLLTHTSGLPDQLPENAELRKSHAPLSEFVKLAIHTPLKFKPGTNYSYQSMGILLASEVVQRITAKPFPDYMASEVFGPLGMKDTAMNLGKHKLADTEQSQVEFSAPEAGAGSEDSKSWDWNSPYWRNLGSPWGGAHSTSTDVTTFLQSFLYPDGKVLKVETARSMVQNHIEGLDRKWGLGFQLGRRLRRRVFGEELRARRLDRHAVLVRPDQGTDVRHSDDAAGARVEQAGAAARFGPRVGVRLRNGLDRSPAGTTFRVREPWYDLAS